MRISHFDFFLNELPVHLIRFIARRYDFYLIPQTVREGTVTPSGFNIIHDTLGLPPSRVQILTFRFTYVYVSTLMRFLFVLAELGDAKMTMA